MNSNKKVVRSNDCIQYVWNGINFKNNKRFLHYYVPQNIHCIGAECPWKVFKFIVMSVSQFHLHIRHLPGAVLVLVVNCDMSHLPALENVFYHILWISAVSFSCHKLHTLSVSVRGVESGLTSLANGEGHTGSIHWKYFNCQREIF